MVTRMGIATALVCATVVVCLSTTVGAQTYNAADYFTVAQNSWWHYTGYELVPGQPVSLDDDFAWIVEAALKPAHGTDATRFRTDADEDGDHRENDEDYFSFDVNGNLYSHGFLNVQSPGESFPAGDFVLADKALIGAPNMAIGWSETTHTSAANPYGFPSTVGVDITSTLVEHRDAQDTPLGTFDDVILMRIDISIPMLELFGQDPDIQSNLFFLARGDIGGGGAQALGMIGQVQGPDDDDAQQQAIDGGEVAGLPIAFTGGQLILTITDGTTSEDATTPNPATFTVALSQPPTAVVDVNILSTLPGEGTVGGITRATVAFDGTNWNVPRTVTVVGVDDDIDDGDRNYDIELTATSTDGAFDGVTGMVALVNLDDDTAGLTTAVTDGQTDEQGGTASFTVVLDTQPVADVTVTAASQDAAEGTVVSFGRAESFTFTDTNWNVPRTVTVQGEDDSVEEAEANYEVVLTVTTADGAYQQLTPTAVELVNVSDDYTIAGQIAYAGPQQGDILVEVFDNALLAGPAVATDVLAAPGAYTVTVEALAPVDYYVAAYRDSDGNQELGSDEASGMYEGRQAAVTVPPSATGIDITLTDPATDTDSLPNWWELLHFGHIDFTNTDDPDNDGRDNEAELAAGTDPAGWRFTMNLAGGRDSTLMFGMQMGACACGTDAWDVAAAGGGDPNVQFENVDGDLQTDVRDVADRETWTFWTEPTGGRVQVDLVWDAADVPPARVLLLEEVDVDGSPVAEGVKTDMAVTTVLRLDSTQRRYFRITFIAREVQEIPLAEGWNMVAICVTPDDASPAAVFQGQIAGLPWSWGNLRYAMTGVVVPLQGYLVWREPNSGTTVLQVPGAPLTHAEKTIQLAHGWNAVGPADTIPQPVAAAIGDAITGLTGTVFAPLLTDAKLVRGKAYWVYITDGSFPLNTAAFE